MVGLALAAAGLLLRQLTGSAVWDGARVHRHRRRCWWWSRCGSGWTAGSCCIGRAADPQLQQVIRDQIEHMPGVDAMLELLPCTWAPTT